MLLPVILAGGSGERLWPLSRTSYPKQFLSLFANKHSLFQTTIQRLPQNANYLPPLVICHEDHRFIVAEQLRQIDRMHSGIILEPCGKNTAPAIALAALWAQQHCPDCTLLILPADQLINDAAKLQDTIHAAEAMVQQGSIVTFGVTITKPESGYGYIEIGANNRINKFIEKPDLATAQALMNNPNYVWNSGMFFCKPNVYLEELEIYAQDILSCCQSAMAKCINDLDFIRPDNESYQCCPANSIDYAIMEHTTKAAVFKLDCAWSDVGNWQAVWENGQKDADGNHINGDVVAHNSSNCILDARHRLLATINVQDLAIIETSDAVLVANKNQAQELRQLVAKLKTLAHPAVQAHRDTKEYET